MTAFSLAASLATALVAGLMVHSVSPPPRSLASRVRPYLSPSLSTSAQIGRGAFGRVFGPILMHGADLASRIIDRPGGEVSLLRLKQAGWFPDIDDEEMVSAYRLAQFKSLTFAIAGGLIVGFALDFSFGLRVIVVALAAVIGATRQRGKVETSIADRRELMRIEVYTVNQLLAMRVRAGGGVVHAVQATVERGHGAVISELNQALRLQRAGWRAADAFRRIAELTPEPFCSRTYRLLASAEERGTDLAGSLLALSEDVRETRREEIKRSATKRRAAMLIPTVAVLAPVLILFVAAPLPYLITGWQ